MKLILISLVSLLVVSISTSLMGQTREVSNQQQISPGLEATTSSYRLLGLSINSLIEEKDKIIQVLRQREKDMDVYLKACGDKPGCTVPIGK